MAEHRFKLVGKVDVDTAMVIITDPCYLKSVDAEAICRVASKATKSGAGGFKLSSGRGEKSFSIQGVASSTGIGDGSYPVYACIVPDPLLPGRGMVEHLFVDFMQMAENPFPELIITLETHEEHDKRMRA